MTCRANSDSLATLLLPILIACCFFLENDKAHGKEHADPAKTVAPDKRVRLRRMSFLVQETFDKGRKWWRENDSGSNWTIAAENGNRFLQLKRLNNSASSNIPQNVCWLKGLNLTDFDLRIKLKSTRQVADKNQSVCICWGRSSYEQRRSSFYYANLTDASDSGPIHIVHEQESELISKRPHDDRKPLRLTDAWQTVRVRRQTKDGLIQVFIDDMETPYAEVYDQTHTKGYIGIGTLDGGEICFDDVEICGRPIRGGDHNDGALPHPSTYEARMYARVNQPKLTTKMQVLAGITFCRVPAGSFIKGVRPSEIPSSYDDKIHEKIHLVDVSEYWISAHEITQAKYEEIMGENPSKNEPLPNKDWRKGEDLSQHPVQGVNWFRALLFCNQLSRKDGRTPCYTIKNIKMYPPPNSRFHKKDIKPWINSAHVSFDDKANGYRLPSDAEWEYACRAGTTTSYSFGNKLNENQANFDLTIGHTTRVGSYPPNQLGIYDMHGNVNEWCHDRFEAPNLLPRQDPMFFPSSVYGSSGEVASINLRGGSYRSHPRICFSGNRDRALPSDRGQNNRSCGYIGIRIVIPGKSVFKKSPN